MGGQGLPGSNGSDGDTGWSPILATVSDGERRVLQVNSWTGGTGTPPAAGGYIGGTGIVPDIASAIDIRGEKGDQGDPLQVDAFGPCQKGRNTMVKRKVSRF